MWNSTPLPRETVLVVDDDRDVLSMAADMLTAAGYAVRSTVDPRAALRLARTHPDPIQLLLTDVVMPLMSGGTLAEEFRAFRPQTHVLFMSAYNIETAERYRVQLGPGEPFLHKPFTMAGLEHAVRAALMYRLPMAWPRRASSGG
jgi:two-component system cell cycle sensor histidine kinase/response regulator CckA